jgi:hypothetical protein
MMKIKIFRTDGWVWLLATAALACSTPVCIHAQQVPSHGQSPEQRCRALANQLHADPHSEAFRRALGSIAACGTTGGEAIAGALRAAKAVQEPDFAERFRFAVAYNQSPVILAALVEVAGDPSATNEMRIVAIEGALRQHYLESAFSRNIRDLASRPAGDHCDIVYVEDGGDYQSTTPLPANSKAVTAMSLRQIAEDLRNPQAVRDAARCVAAHLTE